MPHNQILHEGESPPDEEKEGNAKSVDNRDPALTTQNMSLFQEIFFVATICSAQLFAQAGIGQTISIIHIIGDSLHITNALELPWLIAGYSLTVGTFILFSGRLGDLYGYKKLLMIGFAWYALWSFVSGFAVWSNKVLFIFSRVFAGMGPAICLPNALAILGSSYPPGKRKSMVFAIFAATAPSGVVGGACFAAVFDLAWWPWTFWSFGIAVLCSIVLTQLFVPDPPRKLSGKAPKSFSAHLLELDAYGAIVGILGLVLFNFAWNQAAISGWKSPECITTLVLGVVCMFLFAWIETKWAPAPLIPFRALSTEHAFIVSAILGGWASFGVWFYYTWQFVLEIRGTPPLLAVAYFSPCVISGGIASVTTGLLMHRIGPTVIMMLAMIAFLIGNVLVAFWPADQIYWGQLFIAMLVTPWGMDMSFPAATLVLSDTLPVEQQGVAASLINTLVNYSVSIGLGFASTVEVSVNHDGTDTELGYRGAMYTVSVRAMRGLPQCAKLPQRAPTKIRL
ncbi:hypothetical protein E8E12_005363 [Didymella heteroderae]|uniref:Major facilitator superfamily (MFS) profile domain-containing protein n=1 Tax=Didymella heteroderae TaxID=1769908 RepID=A0A9P4WJB2_9PLEO|nr:hypothetical protein E8E12_005363 [Didymella heteroderae]